MPVVVGEDLYTKAEFRKVFEKQRGGHHQSRHLRLRRHPGVEGDRRYGRAVLGRASRRTTTTARRSGWRRRSRPLRLHPQLPDHRLLRPDSRRSAARSCAERVRRPGRLHRPSRPRPASASTSTRRRWRATSTGRCRPDGSASTATKARSRASSSRGSTGEPAVARSRTRAFVESSAVSHERSPVLVAAQRSGRLRQVRRRPRRRHHP